MSMRRLRDSLARSANVIGLLFVIALLVIVIGVVSPSFFSPFNLFTVTRGVAIDIIIGFSMMVVLALGHMNLAIGSIGVCCVMITGYALESLGLPIAAAVALALVAGLLLGALNGILIVKSGIHSFVITLATASLYFGLMLLMTKAEAFRALPPELTAFGRMRIGAVSGLLVVTALAALALTVIFNFSSLGRAMLASGANPVAAQWSGLPVHGITIFAHALSGILAAIAGVLVTARLAAALPSVGQDWLLPSFLAPLLGGALLAGGYISISGTILGAVLVALLQNGLVLMNVSGFWVQFYLGLALLAAVSLDRWRSHHSQKWSMASSASDR